MIDDKEIQLLKDGLQGAAVKTLMSFASSFEGTVFPIWQRTIHSMLKEKGCPCQEGKHEHCFLHLSPDEQQYKFQDNDLLSFNGFCNLVQEGLVEAPVNAAKVA